MPAVIEEAAPELAEQVPEAESGAVFAGPEADPHAEVASNMTAEQAIQVCPYLGRLAAQDPELAEQKAQEYMSDPEKMAQMHPGEEGEEGDPDEEDSFWADLEKQFSTDETDDEPAEEDTEDREPELSEGLENPSEAEPELESELEPEPEPEPTPDEVEAESIFEPDPEPEAELRPEPDYIELEFPPELPQDTEPEFELPSESRVGLEPAPEELAPINGQFDFDGYDAAAQEESQRRQSLDYELEARRRHIKSEDHPSNEVNVDSIVYRVIAANPLLCDAYKNGDTEALDILAKECKELSRAIN